MNDKLQQLTDKGKQEGEAILAEARKRAEEIIAQANRQADEIIGKAKADAEDYRHKIESDVKMASAQSLQATKKDIENLIVGKIAAEPVKKNLEDGAFLRKLPGSSAQRILRTWRLSCRKNSRKSLSPSLQENSQRPWAKKSR